MLGNFGRDVTEAVRSEDEPVSANALSADDAEPFRVCLKSGEFRRTTGEPDRHACAARDGRCCVICRGHEICIATQRPPPPYCPSNPLLFISEDALGCGTLARFRRLGLDWRKVLRRLPTAFLPWSIEYNTQRLLSDRLFQLFPDIIVFARDARDVRRTISLSKRFDLPVSIRAGGHLRQYYSIQHPILIDVTPMRELRFLRRKHGGGVGAIRVGAGVRIGPVYNELADRNLVLAAGTCPSVGMTGLMTSGGFGFSQRLFGLLSDQLLAARIVTADGVERRISERREPDLFWAIRGAGGGNYGVITSMTLRVHPLRKGLALFRIEWPLESAADAIEVFERWGPSVDPRLTAQLNVSPESASLEGTLLEGDAALARKLLRPMLRVPGTGIAFIRDGTLREHYETYGAADVASMKRFPFFINRNSYVFKPLSRRGIETFVEQIKRGADVPGAKSFGLWAMRGAIADVPSDATAFYPRRARLWFLLRTAFRMQHHEAAVEAYATEFFEAVRPFLSPFVYPNFPLADLPNYMFHYWGRNVPRLRRVKTAFDPDNFFRFHQSVRPLDTDNSASMVSRS